MEDIMNAQGYVFSDQKRFFINWIVPIMSFLCCCFSIPFFSLWFMRAENKGAHLFSAAVFAFLSLFQIYMRKKSIKLYTLQYICKNNSIQNFNKSYSSFVDTSSSLFVSKIHVAGTSKVPWSEDFYVLSNKPLPYVANYEGNGMLVIHSLINDVVILPINNTTGIIVEQLAKDTTIPVYPKVMYLQQ